MSGRDRERDRRAAVAAASARTNEYFVPKDGIDREVITADICRYLGNDALVRPGNYEHPQTRQVQQGYFITAYRNLTTAMIADLKADSERWEAERRQTASRGQPSNVGYRDSTTHQSRQYYGPTEQVQGSGGYSAAAVSSNPQGVYDSGPQYQQQQSYAQPPQGYGQQGYAVQDTNNYFVAGGDLAVDSRSRVPVVPAGNVPRSNYASTPTYSQQPERSYYSGPPGPSTIQAQQAYPTQPTDPYYGRAVPVSAGPSSGTYDTDYDRGYQDTYGQPPLASASNAPATSNTSSRRREEREPSERDSRHHGSSGRSGRR